MIAAGSPKGIIISVIKTANVQDAVASKALLFQNTQHAQPFPFTDSHKLHCSILNRFGDLFCGLHFLSTI